LHYFHRGGCIVDARVMKKAVQLVGAKSWQNGQKACAKGNQINGQRKYFHGELLK